MPLRRICTTCQSFKELDEFACKKDGKDGRASKCKECLADDQALRRQTPAGMAYEQRYVSEHRQRKLERLAQWRLTHPDRLREIKKAECHTPLGKLLRRRRQARYYLKHSLTLDGVARWQERLIMINQQIQMIREDLTC